MRHGIKTVADRAGVSTATVSHVINNTRFVSDETKQKVFLAMEELDYRPNFVARSLRSQKSKTIGLIVPMLPSDTSNFFFMTVAQGVQSTLKQHGYHLLLSNNSTEDTEDEKEQIQLFNSQLIDGLILASSSDDVGYLGEVVGNKYPVVFIDRKPANFNGDFVTADGYGGTYEAMEQLIGKGHRKIGFITGGLGITTSDERFSGYKNALKRYGIEFDPSRVQIAPASFENGYECARKLLTEHDLTALFIANNVLTMGAMMYLQERKIRIPEDLAVIGYDDYDWTKITSPPLSVIRQPAYEIGVKAAEVMLNRIEKAPSKYRQHRLKTTLVSRGSY